MTGTKRFLAFTALVFALFQLAANAASPVKRIVLLTDHAGRVDWGYNNLLAIDAMGVGDTYDVYTLTLDGKTRRCLTCGSSALPPGNRGNPAWHPSGKYIAFQAAGLLPEMMAPRRAKMLQFLTTPGSGWRNDLWVMDAEGKQFWQITHIGRGGGVLHPQFSPDGLKLFWAERTGNGGRGGMMGAWQLRLADFTTGDGAPRVSNIRTYTPVFPNGFYESHSIFPDNRRLLFTADPPTGIQTGFDIYVFDPQNGKITNLTNSPGVWDEHAHVSPSGRHIIWMSSRGFDLPQGAEHTLSLETEYWLMNADGSNPQQLTHFNTPGVPRTETQGGAAADVAWAPDGHAAVGYFQMDAKRGMGKLYLIEFNEPQ